MNQKRFWHILLKFFQKLEDGQNLKIVPSKWEYEQIKNHKLFNLIYKELRRKGNNDFPFKVCYLVKEKPRYQVEYLTDIKIATLKYFTNLKEAQAIRFNNPSKDWLIDFPQTKIPVKAIYITKDIMNSEEFREELDIIQKIKDNVQEIIISVSDCFTKDYFSSLKKLANMFKKLKLITYS